MNTAWHPHTETPEHQTTAIIAAPMLDEQTLTAENLLSGELYWFDARIGRWIGETSGLLLHSTRFWWLNEVNIVGTLTAENGRATGSRVMTEKRQLLDDLRELMGELGMSDNAYLERIESALQGAKS